MIISTKPIMDSYQADALNLLTELRDLKERIKALEEESRQTQQQLAIARAAGDLEHLKDPDPEKPNTYRHADAVFVFSPGRVSYDFKGCDDVVRAESALKEVKATSIALGLAIQKTGKPFWTVK